MSRTSRSWQRTRQETLLHRGDGVPGEALVGATTTTTIFVQATIGTFTIPDITLITLTVRHTTAMFGMVLAAPISAVATTITRATIDRGQSLAIAASQRIPIRWLVLF